MTTPESSPTGPLNRPLTPMSASRWALVALLLVAALGHRWHGMGRYPEPTATLDEQHYVWSGASLIENGAPTSWSMLTCYLGSHCDLGQIQIGDKGRYHIVRPALDHPPLFSLAAGGWARLTGARRTVVTTTTGREAALWEFDMARTRSLSVFLSALSLVLLFDLARRSFGFGAAATALLLYGFLAPVVAHQRLLVTENLTTPLFLLQLVVLLRWLRGEAGRGAFIAVTVATTALALLCKLVAVSQAGAVAVILLACGRPKEIIWPALGAALGLGLYLAYGAAQGWGDFAMTLTSQQSRFDGFNSLFEFVVQGRLVQSFVFNPGVFLGWICVMSLPLLRRPAHPVLLAAPGYLMVFTFFCSSGAIYGWHTLPFYPLLCLALAAAAAWLWERDDTGALLGLSMLTLPFIAQFFFTQLPESGGVVRWLLPAAAIAIAACAAAGSELQRQKAMRGLLAMSVGLLVWVDFTAVWVESARP